MIRQASVSLNAAHEKRLKQADVHVRVAHSQHATKARLRLFHARQQHFQALFDRARHDLDALVLSSADQPKKQKAKQTKDNGKDDQKSYRTLLERSIVQAMLQLIEPRVHVLVRPADESIAQSVLPRVLELYKDVSGRDCQVEIKPALPAKRSLLLPPFIICHATHSRADIAPVV